MGGAVLGFGLALGLLVAIAPGCAAPRASSLEEPTLSAATPDLRQETDAELLERVVLSMLDGEALYTVAAGVKPVSSGFWRSQIAVGSPDLSELARVHLLLRSIPDLDGLEFGVMAFDDEHDGRRHAQAWVAHRRALGEALEEHAGFFAPLGIGPHQDADEVLAIVERLPRLDRFRGYGYLFGYPDEAVDFFVRAAEAEQSTGERVPREFAHVPTHAAEKHRFVWAVPAGHVEDSAERDLRARAAPILERYRALRERFIGPDKPGAADLLRATARLQPASSTATSAPADKNP